MRTLSPLESLEQFLEEQEELTRLQNKRLEQQLNQLSADFKKRFPQVTLLAITGSYLHPELFSKDSDLDFIVAGLPPEDYFAAYLFIESRVSRPIDLIREEEIPESYRLRTRKVLI